MNYIEINSNTEEGFQDLIFNIERYWRGEHENHIVHVRGTFEGNLVGFKIEFRADMKPGIIENEIDNTVFYHEGIILSPIGKELDEFIKALSRLYDLEYKNHRLADTIKLTCFALGGNPLNFDEEDLKFKVFHDVVNDAGLYAEMYININIEQGIVEFKEKDIEYRKNIFRALTGEKPNILIKI